MGASAKNQMVTNLKNTIWGWKKLTGRKFSDPVVQREIKHLPYEVVEGPDGSVGIRVHYLGEKQLFVTEQVTAMLLTKLKEIGESNLKTKVVDCVISVPCYFTDVQRRSLLDAAQIAGLNVLRLMNDTAATALNYGIYKQDLPAPEEKPRHVVFLDMGTADLQLSACAFNKGKLRVLAVAYDSDLGGADFDRLIANHFAEEFKGRYRIDARANPRAYIRLLSESERLKKLMSANTQEIPLNIECFIDEKDVTGKMCREAFEKLSARLLDRAETSMRQLLQASKLSQDDIYSVEVVGGSCRIPAIKDLVRKVFNKDASTTLNADEAVARGCALQCAILSPNFRVRDFSVTDAQLYPISLSWQGSNEEGGSSDMEICGRFHQIPFSKMLTFYRKEPFILEARYCGNDTYPPDNVIGTFRIDKVVPQSSGESSKVKVKVRVNINGLFNVSTASMTEKIENAEAEAEQPMDVDGSDKKQPSDDNEKPKEQQQQQSEEKMDQQQADQQQQATTTNENDESKDDKKTAASPPPPAEPKKPKFKPIDLPVSASVLRMSPENINLYFEREGKMKMQDKLEKERADSKNAVEEYVYEMRNKISDELINFITENDRESFLRQLEETENWLYEDGEDESKQVYIDRLAALKKVGQPVVIRHREFSERPKAFELLGQAIQLMGKVIEAYDNKEEKYDHIEPAEMDKVRAAVAERASWMERQIGVFSQLSLFSDPPISVTQINSQRESLFSACNPIVTKPKPKPKEEPPKEGVKPESTDDAAVPLQTNGPKVEEPMSTDQQPPTDSDSKADMELD
jgi:heat shock protein 4